MTPITTDDYFEAIDALSTAFDMMVEHHHDKPCMICVGGPTRLNRIIEILSRGQARKKMSDVIASMPRPYGRRSTDRVV